MKTQHLTDDEIQELAMKKSVEDIGMPPHLGFCAECKSRLEEYRVLFAGLEQQSAVSFEFDLEQLVLQKLPTPRPAIGVGKGSARYLLLCVALIFSGAIALIFREYMVLTKMLVVFFVFISATPVLLLICAEIYNNYRRKMLLLGFN